MLDILEPPGEVGETLGINIPSLELLHDLGVTGSHLKAISREEDLPAEFLLKCGEFGVLEYIYLLCHTGYW